MDSGESKALIGMQIWHLVIYPSNDWMPCILCLYGALAYCKEGYNSTQPCGRHIGNIQGNFLE
eukprot:640443-Ditylum_brightwellii.AAC.1